MNYSFVFAFIVSLVCCLTTVDARRHGAARFRSQFGEQGSTSDSLEDSTFGFLRLCAQRRIARHRWLPDFLKNVSSDDMIEFCNIVKNDNLTKAVIEQQLDEWAQKQGEEIHDEFNKYLQQETQKLYTIQQKIQQLIVNVTQFIDDVEAIQNDEQLTRKEEKEELSKLVNASDRTVLALAKKIRAEADSEFSWRGGRSSPKSPSFRHQRPSFGSRTRGGASQFQSGNGETFRKGGFSEGNGPYGEKGPYEQNGNPGQAGFWGNNEPMGQFGNAGQNGPFEEDGNFGESRNSGQNGRFGYEGRSLRNGISGRNGLLGRSRYSTRNGRFGYDESLSQDENAE